MDFFPSKLVGRKKISVCMSVCPVLNFEPECKETDWFYLPTEAFIRIKILKL